MLLRDVSSRWTETTEKKTRFARRPAWRRRLLNPRLTTGGHQKRRIREFLAAYGPESIVIDVGASLQRIAPNIVNLDLIPTPGIDLVGDLHELPLVDDSVDAIIATGVLEHVERVERVVDEIHRVLRPGGRLYATFPFLQGYHPSPTDFRRFTPEGARQAMEPFRIDTFENTRGSGSTITWILSSFLAELVSFGRPRPYGLAKAAFGWLLMPVKYMDYILNRNPFDHYITSGFTVIGTKE